VELGQSADAFAFSNNHLDAAPVVSPAADG
jgi:hypothetical protein